MITSLLHIERRPDHYAVEVMESSDADPEPRRAASGRLPLPLPALPDGAGDPLAVLPRLLLSDEAPALRPQDAAAYLFRLLADHGLGDWLEEVRRSELPRSVRLHVEDPELRRLPWEMMVAQESAWTPFLDRTSSWTRASSKLEELGAVAPPVRVLFVAGAYDDVKLHADDELDAIMRALCRRPADFHVEYLVAPTKEEFDAAYAEVDPHVLHVVAHGEQSYGETVLSLRAGEEGAWSLTRVHVANRLPSYPRLVVLNACRSGAGSAATEAAWGFAELFLDKGVGAVVTMQGDIPAVEAVAFTEAFYTALAAREPVDVATHQGRLAVYDETDSPRVWSIPTLSLGAPPESILGTPEPRPASSRLEAVVVEAVGYVDRATERRRVWTRAAPDGPRKPPRLLVVTGGDRTGKSAVVKGALPACHARGCDIAYVDFGPSTRLGWFAAVKRVYDDLRDWLPEHDEPMRHFADVAETCRTGPYHEGRPGPMRELGEELRFENEGDVGEHRKKVIFRELLHLVEACGTENKLLLVLDHLFTGLSDEARDDYLLPRLVQPLLDEEESNVVLVAVVPKNHQLSLSGPAAALEPVEVKAFEKPEFELLLREYVARTKPDAKLLPDQKLLVKTLAGMKQSWEVRDLTIYGAAAAQ